jgi:hypothetical protein
MSADLQKVMHNTQLLLEKQDATDVEAKEKVQDLIDKYGGVDQAAHNTDAVREISGALVTGGFEKAPVTANTLGILATNLDDLLSQNRESFGLKLDGAKQEIEDTINRSTAAILRRFDQGPHDLLEDEDVRDIWMKAGWKLSVKKRLFGEGKISRFWLSHH